MKRFVLTALWPLVELGSVDDMGTMIKKVVEAYKGESYISWMNRINQQAELADLESIQAQEIQLMKFCQGLNKSDRLYDKLMELEVPSWARAQEIIKKHAQGMAQKAVLVDWLQRPKARC